MTLFWFLAGGMAELVNAFLRTKSVRLIDHRKPTRSVSIIAVGFVIRLAWTALIFGLALWDSPASGLAALIGYWLFRWIVIWWLTKH